MERRIFFEHYRICTNQDGSPQEVSRTGAAIEYKAIDMRSNEAVRLQLIPMEYLEGETADSWIVAHGPMAADAVLRIGLQVVRAIKAAAFFNLTHRAIQPSNLKIVPGQSPDGGWPFVKVLNFGIAGLELHSASTEASELAPSISPQFASPEQLLNREIDFRSEMYSLGATMCFLLTAATPLAVTGMKARLRLQRLPELRRAPKVLHDLLLHLLRENPENRPQDPVAFEKEMRECLNKIERRQAIGRKLGIPLAGVVPRKPKRPKQPPTPFVQILRGIAAFAVLVLAAAAAGAFLFPDKIPFVHRSDKVGVPVGVPNAEAYAVTPVQTASVAPVAVNQPIQNPPPAIANASPSPPDVQANQTANAPSASQPVTPSTPAPEENPPQVASAASQPVIPSSPAPAKNPPQVASATRTTEPPPPAAGPDEDTSTNSEQSSPIQSSRSRSSSKTKSAASTSNRPTSSRKSAQSTRRFSDQQQFERRPIRQGWTRAQLIGRTADGRMILRLPSGRIVMLRPRYEDDDAPVPAPRRRVYIQRPGTFVPPAPGAELAFTIVPHHAAPRLHCQMIKAGRPVAICDQTSEPQSQI